MNKQQQELQKLPLKLSEPFNYENDSNFAKIQPKLFWDQIASKYIKWDKKYESIFNEDSLIYPEWFKGGLLNACYNALDVHVMNPWKKDNVAIIYECPFLNLTSKITYNELYERVCEFSRVLLNLNVKKGDIVIIHMPNSIEGIIAMLSCARIGAIHCVLYDCFNVVGFTDRLNTLTPKLIIASNYGIVKDEIQPFLPVLNEALKQSNHKPDNIVILNRKNLSNFNNLDIIDYIPNSVDWDEQVLKSKSNPFYDYIPVESNHPLYLLFTSGTTGAAKPIVCATASFLVSRFYLWDITTDGKLNTFFSISSMGWVSFHYAMYSSLLIGNSNVILEGGFSKSEIFINKLWELMERNKVSIFGTIPRTVRFIYNLDPTCESSKKYDLSNLKLVRVSGDVCDSSLIDYIENKIGATFVSTYGQTETSSLVLTSHYKNETVDSKGQCKPPPFINIEILSNNGEILKDGQVGEMCCKLPIFPGFALAIYKDKEKFEKLFSKYSGGYYCTGDLAVKENGFINVVSRCDDIVKMYGLRIELSRIEQSIFKHQSIADCCCVGLKFRKNDNPFGDSPIGILVLKNTFDICLNQLKNEINLLISNDISPNANLTSIIVVSNLPKTKNGKVVRGLITNLLNDNHFQIPKTFEEVDLLNEILLKFLENKSIGA